MSSGKMFPTGGHSADESAVALLVICSPEHLQEIVLLGGAPVPVVVVSRRLRVVRVGTRARSLSWLQ